MPLSIITTTSRVKQKYPELVLNPYFLNPTISTNSYASYSSLSSEQNTALNIYTTTPSLIYLVNGISGPTSFYNSQFSDISNYQFIAMNGSSNITQYVNLLENYGFYRFRYVIIPRVTGYTPQINPTLNGTLLGFNVASSSGQNLWSTVTITQKINSISISGLVPLTLSPVGSDYVGFYCMSFARLG